MAARATVIIPTFGPASFAQWAVKSAQQQTVKDMEICIICDGSPESMVTFFRRLTQDDPRVQVFAFPKAPRTGEPYRDHVIRQTTGKIICYCCHDDLWFPHHVEVMEAALRKRRFVHSLHAAVNPPEKATTEQGLFERIYLNNLKDRKTISDMRGGINHFGLTYGAHTRDSYFQLQEGWVTTPREDIPTDLYMWCKFLTAFPHECGTITKITALNFRFGPRKAWPEQQRDDELKHYFDEMRDPHFAAMISRHLLRLKIRKFLRHGWRQGKRAAAPRGKDGSPRAGGTLRNGESQRGD